ncbi:MAG: CinA family protein [Geminicoccaceae bacterium]|nr:CinA family protein [Geminicoccaceae bacterium]
MNGNDTGLALARALIETCATGGLRLAVAESCTGGMVAATITDIAGSSAVLDRGFVTYSNEAKVAMVGVRPGTLEAFGAVSRQTAVEMAEGALAGSRADIAVSVTGIAGPGGGSEEKPVGLVHFACARRGGVIRFEHHRFVGDRRFVREAAVNRALALMLEAAG